MSDWGQNTDDSVDGSPYVQQLELYPGQPCISCSTPTEPGSGNFVNRIFSVTTGTSPVTCALSVKRNVRHDTSQPRSSSLDT